MGRCTYDQKGAPMKMLRLILLSFLLAAGLIACGGSSDDNNSEMEVENGMGEELNGMDEETNEMDDIKEPETGVFIDSPVQGLLYTTASMQGITNANGEFQYVLGEEVTFSIGDLDLPPVVGMSEVTPYDIFATDEIYNPSVINLARLLQSLDVDGDPNNGIEISSSAHLAFSITSLDFSGDDFDAEVNALLGSAGSMNNALISASSATDHLFTSLGIQVEQGCGSDHPLVGTQTQFTTYFHDVSGTLTVTDNCTLTVTNFNYDGEGPSVAFYTGLDGDYSNGQAISSMINGQAYFNRTFVLNLPLSLSLDDFNGVSVWCYDFHANFGDAIFSE